MNILTFRALLTPAGQEVLASAMALTPRESNFLRDFTILSRRFPDRKDRDSEVVRAALETAILRNEAAVKFPGAGRMYFTREALEQASAHEVSVYRAERYHLYERIIDLGCAVGSDTLALAEIAPTTGLDLDPLRLAMAQANAQALNLSNRATFIHADLTASLPISPTSFPPGSVALFFDPARRTKHRRAFSVRDYHPPLEIIRTWLPHFPALGVKISPGVDLAELEGFNAEVEFISVRGELKEATLWFGPLRTAHGLQSSGQALPPGISRHILAALPPGISLPPRRATILPGPFTLIAAPVAPHAALDAPRAYLYEPDPAVLRAGLVTTLGEQLGAAQLDPDIAYLTAEKQTPTPFARVWAVEDWFPFGLKRLRAYLRGRGIGRVVVKKRGSPLEPEALIRDLRLSGELERTVFLTHLSGKPIVVIAKDITP